MAKIDYHKAAKKDLIRKQGFEVVESEYQQKIKNKQDIPEFYINLGPHKKHKRKIINGPFGPHARKLVCVTCKNKFISWLSKA